MQHFISACLAFEKTVGKILERQHKHAARNGLRQVKFPRWIDCVFRVFVDAMPYQVTKALLCPTILARLHVLPNKSKPESLLRKIGDASRSALCRLKPK